MTEDRTIRLKIICNPPSRILNRCKPNSSWLECGPSKAIPKLYCTRCHVEVVQVSQVKAAGHNPQRKLVMSYTPPCIRQAAPVLADANGLNDRRRARPFVRWSKADQRRGRICSIQICSLGFAASEPTLAKESFQRTMAPSSTSRSSKDHQSTRPGSDVAARPSLSISRYI